MLEIYSLLLLAFAVSMDSFNVGFTYGMRRIAIPLYATASVGGLAGHRAAGNVASSIGNTGSPFVRSNTNTYPCFDRLDDGVDRAPVLPQRHQARRRGEIAIPQVVAHGLKVPDALAGRGIQRQKGIRKQVVAQAIGAVEIAGRRSCRRRRRCRAPRRAPCPTSCSRRRCTSTRLSARSRSRTRLGAESCGTTSGARLCARRTREYRPGDVGRLSPTRPPTIIKSL